MAFNYRLLKLIKESEYKTQDRIAEIIGVDKATISRVLHGKQRPNPKVQKGIMELFQVDEGIFSSST